MPGGLHCNAMLTTPCHEKLTPTRCNLADIDPFPTLPRCERPKGGQSAAKIERSPLEDQIGRPSAAARGLPLRLRSSVKDFAVGAVFLAAWSAVWSLLIFAYQSPLERDDSEDSIESSAAAPVLLLSSPYQEATLKGQTEGIGGSAFPGDPPPSCGTGMIELDGRCVLGEEIEVGPPAGWRRELNGRASTQ